MVRGQITSVQWHLVKIGRWGIALSILLDLTKLASCIKYALKVLKFSQSSMG